MKFTTINTAEEVSSFSHNFSGYSGHSQQKLVCRTKIYHGRPRNAVQRNLWFDTQWANLQFTSFKLRAQSRSHCLYRCHKTSPENFGRQLIPWKAEELSEATFLAFQVRLDSPHKRKNTNFLVGISSKFRGIALIQAELKVELVGNWRNDIDLEELVWDLRPLLQPGAQHLSGIFDEDVKHEVQFSSDSG